MPTIKAKRAAETIIRFKPIDNFWSPLINRQIFTSLSEALIAPLIFGWILSNNLPADNAVRIKFRNFGHRQFELFLNSGYLYL
ncbi:hypothetical protein COO59_06875 [Mixta theicola]|uniref:Uncharacterized protein n=1 Tax=Mixta theicola TaxID=1458355 RepID=A0A2K1QB29_9GAMM|nr:hypothetical protein [Mixta theicola]PNS12225.1 hypothetical protein COO59_06875 [Mixta theicola]